jgi:hypothetical protein
VGSYWIVLSLDYRRKRKATVDALGPNMRLGKGTRRATRNDELLVTHLVGADSKTAKELRHELTNAGMSGRGAARVLQAAAERGTFEIRTEEEAKTEEGRQ